MIRRVLFYSHQQSYNYQLNLKTETHINTKGKGYDQQSRYSEKIIQDKSIRNKIMEEKKMHQSLPTDFALTKTMSNYQFQSNLTIQPFNSKLQSQLSSTNSQQEKSNQEVASKKDLLSQSQGGVSASQNNLFSMTFEAKGQIAQNSTNLHENVSSADMSNTTTLSNSFRCSTTIDWKKYSRAQAKIWAEINKAGISVSDRLNQAVKLIYLDKGLIKSSGQDLALQIRKNDTPQKMLQAIKNFDETRLGLVYEFLYDFVHETILRNLDPLTLNDSKGNQEVRDTPEALKFRRTYNFGILQSITALVFARTFSISFIEAFQQIGHSTQSLFVQQISHRMQLAADLFAYLSSEQVFFDDEKMRLRSDTLNTVVQYLNITGLQLLRYVKSDPNFINYFQEKEQNARKISPILNHQLCLIERFIFSAITICASFLQIHNKSYNGSNSNSNGLSHSPNHNQQVPSMNQNSNASTVGNLDPDTLHAVNQILLTLLDLTNLFDTLAFQNLIKPDLCYVMQQDRKGSFSSPKTSLMHSKQASTVSSRSQQSSNYLGSNRGNFQIKVARDLLIDEDREVSYAYEETTLANLLLQLIYRQISLCKDLWSVNQVPQELKSVLDIPVQSKFYDDSFKERRMCDHLMKAVCQISQIQVQIYYKIEQAKDESDPQIAAIDRQKEQMRQESFQRLDQAQSLKNSVIIDHSLESQKILKTGEQENLIKVEEIKPNRYTELEDQARHQQSLDLLIKNKFTIESIEYNKVIPEKFKETPNYKEDWKRVNIAILKIVEICACESQGNLQKQNENFTSSQTSSSPSKNNRGEIPEKDEEGLDYIFDLIQVHIYMVMQNKMHFQFDTSFSGFQTQVEFLSRIPETSQYFNCGLSQILNHTFALTQGSQSMSFKKGVKQRIIDILGSLKGGAYDFADQNHYLKLIFLLYIQRYSFILKEKEQFRSQATMEQIQKTQKQIFETFFSFFRTEFYPQKFLSLFEDTFDTDSISNVNHLIEIIYRENTKSQSNIDKESQVQRALCQVNLALIQKYSINLIVIMSLKSQTLLKLGFKRIKDEFEREMGKYFTNDKPSISVTQSHVNLKLIPQLPYLDTEEYFFLSYNSVRKDQKRSKSTLSSKIYMLLKISIMLLQNDPNSLKSYNIFHTLFAHENHYLSQHTLLNRIFAPNSQNTLLGVDNPSNEIRTTMRVSIPGGQVNSSSTCGGGTQTTKQCDDCLKAQFKEWYVSNKTDVFQMKEFQSLLKKVLNKIRHLSSYLEEKQAIQLRQLSHDFTKATSVKSMLTDLQMTSSFSSQNLEGQNQLTQNIIKQSQQGNTTNESMAKIDFITKMSDILERFLVYLSQDYQISTFLLQNLFEGDSIAFDQKKRRKEANSDSKPSAVKSPNKLDYNLYQEFSRIKSNEQFKLLILRNLTFHTKNLSRENDDLYSWPIIQINRCLMEGLKSWNEFVMREFGQRHILADMNSFERIKQAKIAQINDRNHLQTGIFEDQSYRNDTKSEPFSYGQQILERLSKEHKNYSDKVRKYFKKVSKICVSWLSIYVNQICKNQGQLPLLERKGMIQFVFGLRNFVITEGSFANDFNLELLNVFLYPKIEHGDPLQILFQDYPKSQSLLSLRYVKHFQSDKYSLQANKFYQDMLEALLGSLVEQIKAAKAAESSHAESKAKKIQIEVKFTICNVIKTLYHRIVNQENVSYELLNFSRSFNRECIEYLKKIMIFLREQVNQTVGLDLENSIKQLKSILVKVFTLVPKAVQLRDFFSLIQEIFYYQTMMDEVDLSLAEDLLDIYHKIIVSSAPQAHQQSNLLAKILLNPQHRSFGRLSRLNNLQIGNYVQDYFCFSKMARGLLLLNNMQMGKGHEFSLLMLYKINFEKIDQDLAEKYSEEIGNFQQYMRKEYREMVLISFSLVQDFSEFEQGNGENGHLIRGSQQSEMTKQNNRQVKQFNIILKCNGDSDQRDACLYIEANYDKKTSKSRSVKIRVDNFWAPLIINHQKSGMLELFVENHRRDWATSICDKKLKFEGSYFMTLGNSCTSIETQTALGANFSGNSQYFRGQISVPFFFKGIQDLAQTMGQSQSTSADKNIGDSSQSRKTNRNESLMSNLVLILTNTVLLKNIFGLDFTFLQAEHKRLSSQQDKLNNAKIANLLDNQSPAQIFEKHGFRRETSTPSTLGRNFQNFVSLDELNATVLHMHSLYSQAGSLSIVHNKPAVEILVSLGGFKNMYPLVQKVLDSNLNQVSKEAPSRLLKLFFQILRAYLNQYPHNIESMTQKRNQFSLLRILILKMGKQEDLSQIVAKEIIAVVKKCAILLSGYELLEEIPDFSQQQNDSATYLNEETKDSYNYMQQIYQIRPLIRDQNIMKYQGFSYDLFMQNFTEKIILDNEILMMQIGQNMVSKGDGRNHYNPTIMIYLVIDFLTKVCNPAKLEKYLIVKSNKRVAHNSSNGGDYESYPFASSKSLSQNATTSMFGGTGEQEGKNEFTDYVLLRRIIVQVSLIKRLLTLINRQELLQLCHQNLIMQIGTCIASSICFLRSESQGILNQIMADIRQLCQLPWKEMPLLKLNVYLYIFLVFIQSKKCSETLDQKKLKAVMEQLTLIIGSETQKGESSLNLAQNSEITSENTIKLKDMIIAMALRIYVTIFVLRNKDKVNENEHKALRQVLFANLLKNQTYNRPKLGTQTYLVYVWIVFDKVQLTQIPADEKLSADMTETMLEKVNQMNVETIGSQDRVSSNQGPMNQLATNSIDQQFNVQSENLDVDLFKYLLQLYKLIGARETENIFLQHMKVIIKTHFRKIQGAIMRNEQLKEAIQDFLQIIQQNAFESKDDTHVRAVINIHATYLTLQTQTAQTKDIRNRHLNFFRMSLGFWALNPNLQFSVIELTFVSLIQNCFFEQKQSVFTNQFRLNLIQILQSIEEFFLANSKVLASQESFQNSILLAMILFDKLNILYFDQPWITSGASSSAQQQDPSNRHNNGSVLQSQQLDPSELNLARSQMITAKSSTVGFSSLAMRTGEDHLSLSSSKSPNQQPLDKLDSLGLQVNTKGFKQTLNYGVSGSSIAAAGGSASNKILPLRSVQSQIGGARQRELNFTNKQPFDGKVSISTTELGTLSKRSRMNHEQERAQLIGGQSSDFRTGGPLRILLHITFKALYQLQKGKKEGDFECFQGILNFLLFKRLKLSTYERIQGLLSGKLSNLSSYSKKQGERREDIYMIKDSDYQNKICLHIIQRNLLYSLKLDLINKLIAQNQVFSNLKHNTLTTKILLIIQQFPKVGSHLDLVYGRRLDRDLEQHSQLCKNITSRETNQDVKLSGANSGAFRNDQSQLTSREQSKNKILESSKKKQRDQNKLDEKIKEYYSNTQNETHENLVQILETYKSTPIKQAGFFQILSLCELLKILQNLFNPLYQKNEGQIEGDLNRDRLIYSQTKMILLMLHDIIDETILSKINFEEQLTSKVAFQMEQIRNQDQNSRVGPEFLSVIQAKLKYEICCHLRNNLVEEISLRNAESEFNLCNNGADIEISNKVEESDRQSLHRTQTAVFKESSKDLQNLTADLSTPKKEGEDAFATETYFKQPRQASTSFKSQRPIMTSLFEKLSGKKATNERKKEVDGNSHFSIAEEETKGQSSQNTSIRDAQGGIYRERAHSGFESQSSSNKVQNTQESQINSQSLQTPTINLQQHQSESNDLIISTSEPDLEATPLNRLDKDTAIFIEVEQSNKQKGMMKLGKSIVAQQLSLEDSKKELQAYQEVAHSGGSSSPHDMEIDLRSGSQLSQNHNNLKRSQEGTCSDQQASSQSPSPSPPTFGRVLEHSDSEEQGSNKSANETNSENSTRQNFRNENGLQSRKSAARSLSPEISPQSFTMQSPKPLQQHQVGQQQQKLEVESTVSSGQYSFQKICQTLEVFFSKLYTLLRLVQQSEIREQGQSDQNQSKLLAQILVWLFSEDQILRAFSKATSAKFANETAQVNQVSIMIQKEQTERFKHLKIQPSQISEKPSLITVKAMDQSDKSEASQDCLSPRSPRPMRKRQLTKMSSHFVESATEIYENNKSPRGRSNSKQLTPTRKNDTSSTIKTMGTSIFANQTNQSPKTSKMTTENSESVSNTFNQNFIRTIMNINGKNKSKKAEKLTLRDLYAKQQYKKIVTRLQEDSSSIWYDHLEQELCEYREISSKYEQITQNLPWVQSIKAQQDEEFKQIVLQAGNQMTSQAILNEKSISRERYGDVIENVAIRVQRYNQTVVHQKLCFVKQRRNVDKWGRMVLLMPNRKFAKKESKKFYKYFVNQYIDNLFALSMLEDNDQKDDLVLPMVDHEANLERQIQQIVTERQAQRLKTSVQNLMTNQDGQEVELDKENEQVQGETGQSTQDVQEEETNQE